MKIEYLGELTPHQNIEEWMVSSEVEVDYFPGTRLRFVLEDIEDDLDPNAFVAAVGNFLKLRVKDREEATPYVYKNYSDFVHDVGEDEIEAHIDSPADVWKYVQPSEIHVSRRPYGDRKVYVQIAANCDWEQEHGLQIIYREGKQLSRVSDQDGHLTHADAYGLPESEDRIC
jgi:hypothetical protein